jgi:hypothetical protein
MLFAVPFVVAGLIAVAFILATGTFSFFEPENGTLANGAKLVTNSGASGGKAVQLSAPVATPTPTSTPTPTPIPTPTGTPPPGGCATYLSSSTAASCGFPTAATTGIPAGTTLAAQEN